MQVHLTKEQHSKLAEKFMNLGNFIFVGLVLGQAFGGRVFGWEIITTGILAWMAIFTIAAWFMRGGERA